MNIFRNSFRLLAVSCWVVALLLINTACNTKKAADVEIQQPETAAVENIMKINTKGDEIKFVRFSPDGEKIYSASWNSMAEFDLSHATQKAVFAGSYNGIGASFFKEKKNKKVLVHGRTGKTVRLPSRFSAALTTVSDDGRYALVKKDKRAEFMIFDIAGKQEIFSFTLSGDYDLAVARFSPDNNYLVLTGFAAEPAILYDRAKGAVQILKEQSGNVMSFAFTPDSKHVLAASYYDLKYWNLGTGEVVRKFPGEDSHAVYSVDVSLDGKLALSGDNAGTVKLWDIPSGKLLKTFKGHMGTVNSVAFSPNGNSALSGSDDGTARLWDIATGKERAQLISFSDGEWVILTSEGYFNASPHGAKYISVRIGDSVYPVDTMNKNLYEKYFVPERVISIVQGKY
ncbi:MAG: hypothetical protein PHH28_13680 [Desulfuromonadaceae bacterium]|nr:hypothetical protein [Desulfuromonadaceae bacterium]